MESFRPDVIEAAKGEREVKLTTYGRKTGKPHEVTIWITTDGTRLYIRSGQGLVRQWPQNLIARGEALLQLARATVKVKSRLVPGPDGGPAGTRMSGAQYEVAGQATEPGPGRTAAR